MAGWGPGHLVLEVLLKLRSIAGLGGRARGTGLDGIGTVRIVGPGAEEEHGCEGDNHKCTHRGTPLLTLGSKCGRFIGWLAGGAGQVAGARLAGNGSLQIVCSDAEEDIGGECQGQDCSHWRLPLPIPEASPGSAPKAPWLS